jgi:hypothetical protein
MRPWSSGKRYCVVFRREQTMPAQTYNPVMPFQKA